MRCPAELAGQAETWGALETFRRRSKESDTIAELEDLMNQIFARRADSVVIPYVPLFPSFLDMGKLYARSAAHLPSAFPNGLLQTTRRDKPGLRTSQTLPFRSTNSENVFHTAQRGKTCSTCYMPTPLRSPARFGSSVSSAQMR